MDRSEVAMVQSNPVGQRFSLVRVHSSAGRVVAAHH
jgi:hypothetical protein